MRRARFLSALTLGLALTGSVHAEISRDFDLSNATGYDIKEVYVSPSRSNDWEQDVLGTNILADGHAVHIAFNRGIQNCSWDVKVVYTDDDSNAVWRSIDICDVEKVTIHYDRGSATASATFD